MAIAVGDPDLGVYSRYKSFGDVTKEADANRLATQAALIDNASKTNIYKTQVLSAAAGSGNPDVVRAAFQHLNERDIDTSDVPTDLPSLTKYTDAARLAQSPLGSLLNAGLKGESNLNQAAGVTGNFNTAASINPLSAAIASKLQGIAGAPATQVMMTQPLDQGSVAIPAKPNLIPADMQTPVGPLTGAIDAPQPTAQGQQQLAQLAFAPPAQLPGETAQAYNQRATMLMKAKEMDPSYIGSKAKAEATGKSQADVAKNADESSQSYNQVVQTLDAIKQMAPNLPQKENLIGPETRAAFNQNFGNGKMAADYSKFQTINEAQTLGAIKELAVTGQIRMTRTLENIINRGFLVDPNLSPQGKIDQANAIQAELRNAAVAAQNTNVNMNGGQEVDMSSPLQAPPSEVQAPVTARSIGNVPAAAVNHLQQNPGLAADFDTKYGAGTSKMILGK